MDSIVRGHGPELCLILEPSRLLEYPSPRRSSNRDATDVRATAALLNYFACLQLLLSLYVRVRRSTTVASGRN